MDELRVLRVIARMNVGGPALQVVALTDGLGPTFEQRLLVGTVDPDEADYLDLRASHLEPHRVAGLGRRVSVAGDVRALAAIRQHVVDFRPHIVHTHTAKAGVLGRIAAFSSRVPITVHTFHGHLLRGYFGPGVTRAVVQAERVLAARTTHLVAVGAQVRDDLLGARIGRPGQYTVVPPGVHVEHVDAHDARASLDLPEDVPVIAFVARLTAVKRPDRAIDAVRRVLTRHPNAILLVVGEGALLDDLRASAAALGDSVRFLGWRGDVDRIYAASDIVLLTSANEGMPVSLIEASAAGRPAVSTRVGSVAEVVDHGVTGILVDEDVDAIAAGIEALIVDPDRRASMGVAAAARADRLFGRERLVADTAALYDRLAKERGLR